MELDPSIGATGSTSSRRVLPPATRNFGRIIDDSGFLPGDLLLTRSFGEPKLDWLSHKIVSAQKAFSPSDAQWTHAAVCVGDGESVCEANFLIPGKKNGVMVRPLQSYADGKHAIKIRRPAGLSDQQRFRIAVGALINLKKSYSFQYLLRLAWDAYRGKGFEDPTHGPIRITSNALVCSTLYADALVYGANLSVSRTSNRCIPAMLSSSPLFDDNVPIGWLSIS